MNKITLLEKQETKTGAEILSEKVLDFIDNIREKILNIIESGKENFDEIFPFVEGYSSTKYVEVDKKPFTKKRTYGSSDLIEV